MTNHWVDIKNADVILVMGGNAAEAHPCGFKWVTEAKAHRKARLIVVDPRFTRTASVADYYAPIRPGSDITFLMAVINWCIQNDKVQWDYVRNYTNAAYIVRDDFGWSDGLFSGYDEEKRDYDKKSWDYVIGDDGFASTIQAGPFGAGLGDDPDDLDDEAIERSIAEINEAIRRSAARKS